jgi:hypothetical protein
MTSEVTQPMPVLASSQSSPTPLLYRTCYNKWDDQWSNPANTNLCQLPEFTHSLFWPSQCQSRPAPRVHPLPLLYLLSEVRWLVKWPSQCQFWPTPRAHPLPLYL